MLSGGVSKKELAALGLMIIGVTTLASGATGASVALRPGNVVKQVQAETNNDCTPNEGVLTWNSPADVVDDGKNCKIDETVTKIVYTMTSGYNSYSRGALYDLFGVLSVLFGNKEAGIKGREKDIIFEVSPQYGTQKTKLEATMHQFAKDDGDLVIELVVKPEDANVFGNDDYLRALIIDYLGGERFFTEGKLADEIVVRFDESVSSIVESVAIDIKKTAKNDEEANKDQYSRGDNPVMTVKLKNDVAIDNDKFLSHLPLIAQPSSSTTGNGASSVRYYETPLLTAGNDQWTIKTDKKKNSNGTEIVGLNLINQTFNAGLKTLDAYAEKLSLADDLVLSVVDKVDEGTNTYSVSVKKDTTGQYVLTVSGDTTLENVLTNFGMVTADTTVEIVVGETTYNVTAKTDGNFVIVPVDFTKLSQVTAFFDAIENDDLKSKITLDLSGVGTNRQNELYYVQSAVVVDGVTKLVVKDNSMTSSAAVSDLTTAIGKLDLKAEAKMNIWIVGQGSPSIDNIYTDGTSNFVTLASNQSVNTAQYYWRGFLGENPATVVYVPKLASKMGEVAVIGDADGTISTAATTSASVADVATLIADATLSNPGDKRGNYAHQAVTADTVTAVTYDNNSPKVTMATLTLGEVVADYIENSVATVKEYLAALQSADSSFVGPVNVNGQDGITLYQYALVEDAITITPVNLTLPQALGLAAEAGSAATISGDFLADSEHELPAVTAGTITNIDGALTATLSDYQDALTYAHEATRAATFAGTQALSNGDQFSFALTSTVEDSVANSDTGSVAGGGLLS